MAARRHRERREEKRREDGSSPPSGEKRREEKASREGCQQALFGHHMASPYGITMWHHHMASSCGITVQQVARAAHAAEYRAWHGVDCRVAVQVGLGDSFGVLSTAACTTHDRDETESSLQYLQQSPTVESPSSAGPSRSGVALDAYDERTAWVLASALGPVLLSRM